MEDMAQSIPQILTFGCRLNTFESEVMKDLAKDAGLDGKTIIVNTCAVTAEAERQARQSIRKARKENPNAQIIVTGCAAQINPWAYAKMEEVDRVMGNAEKLKKESFLPEISEKVLVNDIMSIKETAPHLVTSFSGRTRAFVEVQNGCDHRCTFCTIPYGRGNSRSVPMGQIVERVRELSQNDYEEVVFTGVDITSYGHDLPGKPTLGQMCRRLLSNVPTLKRLRLSSVDPVEIDEDIFQLVAEEPRFMPHFHLSLQAGDDMILKRMKRRHLRHHVIDLCKKLRSLRSDIVFGADIIAGFPTETEEMFQNSLRIVDECNLTFLHVFPYSPRPDTPAARMPQVPKEVRKERARLLREKGVKQIENTLKSYIGKDLNILIEKEGFGRSEHFLPVQIISKTEQFPAEGTILTSVATSSTPNHLMIDIKN